MSVSEMFEKVLLLAKQMQQNILINHEEFSELSTAHIASLVRQKYVQLVQHILQRE